MIETGKILSGTPGNNTRGIFHFKEVNATPVFLEWSLSLLPLKNNIKFPGSESFFHQLFRFSKISDLVLLDEKFTSALHWSYDFIAHTVCEILFLIIQPFANRSVKYKNTIKGIVSRNGKITGVRGDSMICSTGELYRKLLPPFQTVITLCTVSLLFLLRGTCYRLSRIGSNWYNVSVHLTAVKLL